MEINPFFLNFLVNRMIRMKCRLKRLAYNKNGKICSGKFDIPIFGLWRLKRIMMFAIGFAKPNKSLNQIKTHIYRTCFLIGSRGSFFVNIQKNLKHTSFDRELDTDFKNLIFKLCS